jgi:tetratricopeptide (TPR) repeat protein
MAYVEAAAGRPLLAMEHELVARVHSDTDGNPFFISEILRHLVDEGSIPLEGGRWTPGVNVADLGIPEGVRTVIGQRLAAMSDHTNRVLATAAVAGREFDLDLLERVDDGHDGDVLDAVEDAIESGLVVESEESVGRFTFAHALVRQTLYADLSAARRALLHRRVGEAIEALHGGVIERHLVELAHHFTQAAFGVRVDKAVDYGTRAAQQATEQLAYEEAMTHLERALSVLDMTDQRDLERRFDLLIAVADVRFRMLDPKGMKAAALEAADIARVLVSPERLVRAAAACGFVLAFGAPDDAIVSLCEEALTEIGESDPKLRAQVLATLAAHLAPSGAGWSVAPLALEAVDLARRAQDVDTLRGALVARFETLTGTPDVGEALALAEELIALSHGGSLQRAAIDGHSRRAVWRLVAGDRQGFEADDARLERLAGETRWTVAMAWCRLWRAVLAMLDGDFDGAEIRATEALALAEEDLFDAFSAQLLWLRFEQGRIVDLKPLAEASAEANPLVVGFQLALAFAHADMGELADARRVIEGLADDGFASVPRDGLWPASLYIATEVVTTLEDEAWAATLYDLVAPHSGLLLVPGAAVLCMGAADRCLGMLATVARRYDDATRHFDAALALESTIHSAVLIARTRYWYGSMLLRRDGDGDRERGLDLLNACIETAQKFQMVRLAQQARAVVSK